MAKATSQNIVDNFKLSGLSSSSNSADGLNASIRQNLKEFADARGFSYQVRHFSYL
jgi:hypothetical protein